MNFAKKLVGNEDERAVSPVIGVILMVAITVILAAVIAAFVLDLGQSQGASPQAGFTIDDSGADTIVTLNSAQRLDSWGAECDSRPSSISASTDAGTTVDAGSCDKEDVIIVGEYNGAEAVMS